MFVFRGDISRPEDERKMTEWEMTLYKFATKHFRSLIVEMLVLGNEVVDYEMNRDARRTAPYFAMGTYERERKREKERVRERG